MRLDMTETLAQWLLPNEQVDLNNCDREPIHMPGAIQPHGYLMAVDAEGRPQFASQNLDQLPASTIDALNDRLLLARERPAAQSCRWSTELIDADQRVGNLILHRFENSFIAELEPGPRSPPGFSMLTDIGEQLNDASNLGEVFEIAVQAVRKLTGFSRTMAYLFDHEGHGAVIAEAKTDDFESYLGLRFPATDIPKQARRLYTMQPSRLIVDVDAAPVPLRALNTGEQTEPINMAFCQLRSVSPIHLEYLRNMEVRASCSFSIIVEGKLVALIACHHHEPRFICFDTRSACELVAQQASSQLQRLSDEDQRQVKNRHLRAQVDLLAELAQDEQLRAKSVVWKNVASFIDADAFLISVHRERASVTIHPECTVHDEIWAIAEQMVVRSPDRSSSEIELSSSNPEAEGGLLVVPIGSAGWIAWYRRPVQKTVVWAGRPDLNTVSKLLTPRASFAAWTQLINTQCKVWTTYELDLAKTLRRGLTVRFETTEPGEDGFSRTLHRLREYLVVLEEANQSLRASNEDLRQFTYVASHDLKSPLRTIRTFLPILEEELGSIPPNAEPWFNYIRDAADSLFRVQQGLLSFSRVTRDNQFGWVDLDSLVRNVRSSLAADLADAEVNVDPLPKVWGVGSQLSTLFENLFQNCAKYESAERRLRIAVAVRARTNDVVIAVSDNGIGFPAEANERVFELFTRLNHKKRDGEGLGLAICRRIVNHHHGWIRAEGRVGQGATFEFLLKRRPFRGPDVS